MADIGFVVEFIVSVVIVMGPIVAIVLLLAHADGSSLSDLVVPRIAHDDDRLPPEEANPPRWRFDRVRAYRTAEGGGPQGMTDSVVDPQVPLDVGVFRRRKLGTSMSSVAPSDPRG